MQKTTVGSIELVALIDMVAAYPAKSVYPKVDDFSSFERYLDSDGSIALNFASFLVRDGSTLLLVDTGWGPEHSGQLLKELDASGVKPTDVTHVLFTHLHGDHTGWNIDRESGQPIFAGARHLVPKADWDHYEAEAVEARKTTNKPWLGSFDRDMVPLKDRGLVDLISGETTVSPSLTAIPTPGHTPGHTSVVITSNGERGIVLGDVVISPVDAERLDFETSFDWDAALAVETRKKVVKRLIEDGSLVGASHLPVPGLGRFIRTDAGQRWQGIGP
ncbi:MAG: MBL fold metallo-hydrolase [Dehalococcoidia bacterium]